MGIVRTTISNAPKFKTSTHIYSASLNTIKTGGWYYNAEEFNMAIDSGGRTLGFSSKNPTFSVVNYNDLENNRLLYNPDTGKEYELEFFDKIDFMMYIETSPILLNVDVPIILINSNGTTQNLNSKESKAFGERTKDYIITLKEKWFSQETKKEIKIYPKIVYNDWFTILDQKLNYQEGNQYAKIKGGSYFSYYLGGNNFSPLVINNRFFDISTTDPKSRLFIPYMILLNLRDSYFNSDDFYVCIEPTSGISKHSVIFRNKDVLYKLLSYVTQGLFPYTTVIENITTKPPKDWDNNWEKPPPDVVVTPPDMPDPPVTGGGGGQPGSNVGGGDGNKDNTSDIIELPSLPTVTSSTSGMVSIFTPELYELNELANYLWRPEFVEAIAKLLQDPMDGIIGLNMIPVLPKTGEKKNVKVGFVNTNVSMYKVTSQFVHVPCGSLKIENYWGNFMDYSPYTKAQLYLPFIGFIDVSVDEFMGGELFIDYYVDLMTGVCQCFVRCKNTNKLSGSSYNAILYSFTGNCATQIPVTSANYNSILQSIAIGIGTVAVGATTGGTGVLATAGSSGALATAGTVAKGAVIGSLETLPGATANAVMGSKISLTRSGGISASGALMSYKKPYIVITRPSQSRPDDYNKLVGVPSNITAKLGDLVGYTQVSSVQLSNINCLGEERIEIENLLKSGVIL